MHFGWREHFGLECFFGGTECDAGVCLSRHFQKAKNGTPRSPPSGRVGFQCKKDGFGQGNDFRGPDTIASSAVQGIHGVAWASHIARAAKLAGCAQGVVGGAKRFALDLYRHISHTTYDRRSRAFRDSPIRRGADAGGVEHFARDLYGHISRTTCGRRSRAFRDSPRGRCGRGGTCCAGPVRAHFSHHIWQAQQGFS